MDKTSEVYSAIYSGVPVYEIMCKEVPIMRRMADSYMNATQILKVAGFSKPRRTKILEQEVLQGLHEKVQGGYGKYQGTWIPIEAGRTLASRYRVAELLHTILEFDPAVDQVAAKPIVPKKPRAPKTFDRNDYDDDDIPTNMEYTIIRNTPSRSRAPSSASALASPPRLSFYQQQEPTPTYHQEPQYEPQDPKDYIPSLVAQRLFDEDLTQRDFFDRVYTRTRTTTGESFIENETIDEPLVPTDFSHLTDDQKTKELLLHIFVESDSEQNTQRFQDLVRSQNDYNVHLILDDKKLSLLHWAASCGRIEIVRFLVQQGVKVNHTAVGGVTALMMAIENSRNYANQTMDELLAMLGPTIFTADEHGKTALHYAANLSRYKSKRAMSSYYMDCMGRYIEDTRSATNSSTIASVDAVDENKDTAFHIACRYRNPRCVMILLSLGASKTLENSKKETAYSIAKHDFRLLKLMEHEFTLEPSRFDNYDDVPTTPISDMTESDVEMSSEYLAPKDAFKRKISSSSLSSISGMEGIGRDFDFQVSKSSRYFINSKSDVMELKHYKDRFDLVQKHSQKISKQVRTPTVTPNAQLNSEVPATEEDSNKRIRLSQHSTKQMLAETRLSSQLIRLDSLVKSSIQEQNEVLLKLEHLKSEREVKDERYNSMLSMVCHVPVSMIDDVFQRVMD